MTIPPPATDFQLFHADLPAPRIRPDYHRFFLDPRTLPSEKIVGTLACQRDSYLRTLSTHVAAARKAGQDALLRAKGVTAQDANAPIGSQKNAKAGKKDKAKENATKAPEMQGDSRELWEVELMDTVLFPEGGGQPYDTGRLVLSPNSGLSISLPVRDVFRRGLTAVHVVELPADPLERETARTALTHGTLCEAQVDWERRYDQCTQHTAQHLLSAICDTHLGLPTLSWFMPPHPSTDPFYVELPRSLTPEEARRMEDICNALVTNQWGAAEEEDAVRVWIESRLQKRGNESATGSGWQTPAKMNGDGQNAEKEERDGLGLIQPMQTFDVHDEDKREWADRESRGLPKDYAGGVIRTAVIDGIDRNLCCGTHHPDLAKIGLIHVLAPITASKKPSRLFAVAGHRATRHLIAASHSLTKASVGLGCARDQVALRAEQGERARRDLVRAQDRTRQELAKALGSLVKWQKVENGEAGAAYRGLVTRTEEATHDFEFLGSLNSAAVENITSADSATSSYALLLHSSVVPMASNGISEAGSLLMIMSNPPELAKQLGDEIKTRLDSIEGQQKGRVKGGGAKGRWMGKITGKWSKADAGALEELSKI